MIRNRANCDVYIMWGDPPPPAPPVPLTREQKVQALAEELSRFFQHAAIRGDMWPATADVVRKIEEAGL